MNIKYYKDLSHNFLIINNKVEEKKQNYQCKMINNNKIRHLLDCKIRFIDEECSFYYEISSKQNLQSLFDKKRMGYEDIFQLMESIKGTLDELDNFLLDSRCLILSPEYIFAEPEREEYFFLYYPCMEESDEQTALMSLAEFLVNKADHGQEKAVEIAYGIYESVQDNRFMLPYILNLFHPHELETEKTDVLNEVWEEKEIKNNEWFENDYPEAEQTNGTNSGEEDNDYLPAVGILAFLCAAAAAGIFGIRYFFILSIEEKLISIVGILSLILLSAVLFVYFILNICKRRKPVNKKQDGIKTEKQKIRYTETKNFYETKIKEGGKEYRNVSTADRGASSQFEEYGNTVFLDTAVCKKENKLYGTNKGNKYHIDLDNLPCTVGKMAGNVDVVIKDSTISRIHARFTRQDNQIYVTDMNSTNGTFKNGLRLNPNETVLIEPGDELRFGRMTFCYR